METTPKKIDTIIGDGQCRYLGKDTITDPGKPGITRCSHPPTLSEAELRVAIASCYVAKHTFAVAMDEKIALLEYIAKDQFGDAEQES
jgi:hypothetical protein